MKSLEMKKNVKFYFFVQFSLTFFNFRPKILKKLVKCEKNSVIFWFKDILSNEIQLLNQKGGVFNSFAGVILYFWGVLSLKTV